MKVTYTGKRGGKKTVEVRTIPQLAEALKRVPRGWDRTDRHHNELMLLGTFIAEQLVELNGGKRGQARGPSEWNRFFAAGMRAGKSPADIGRGWQERKVKRVAS